MTFSGGNHFEITKLPGTDSWFRAGIHSTPDGRDQMQGVREGGGGVPEETRERELQGSPVIEEEKTWTSIPGYQYIPQRIFAALRVKCTYKTVLQLHAKGKNESHE